MSKKNMHPAIKLTPPPPSCDDPPSPVMKVHTFVMHFSQELFKVTHVSKERVDVPEIFHIIAKVPHGRAVDRTDPN